MVAQLPGLLRGESPSYHNSGVNLHIMCAEFVPAGGIPRNLKIMLAMHREAGEVGACPELACSLDTHQPPTLGWLSETVLSLHLFPPVSSSALHACLTLPDPNICHLSPLPPHQNLKMDGGFLIRTWRVPSPAKPPWKRSCFWVGIPTWWGS